MHGLMSYQRFGRARSLHSDQTLVRARSLRSDVAGHAFGRRVTIRLELFSDDSRFFRKGSRRLAPISTHHSGDASSRQTVTTGSQVGSHFSSRAAMLRDCQ
ncbi:hypothetical protein F2Q69_00028876 [Brassica cretica]|uniref:Uncharacterized protein n=1 Tax=Brassica cretica TaxID=69181 RepID=A0A8S9RR35_BRACR|nr:hypothetical protein F2Q69_00028876 [Brassica cretica]